MGLIERREATSVVYTLETSVFSLGFNAMALNVGSQDISYVCNSSHDSFTFPSSFL